MKQKPYLLIILVCLLCSGLAADAFAQGKSKQNGPPPWAPAHGYRAKTRHVYFPQHNFYFDMQRGVYIYLNGSNWVTAIRLPSLFGRIDLARSTQIELDFGADDPYRYNRDHQVKYKGKRQHTPAKSKSAGPPTGGKGNSKGNNKGNGNGGGKGKGKH